MVSPSIPHHEIIIIGAGISGLSVAHHLKPELCLILEARDRCGGRMHSEEWFGYGIRIENGAQFIHGRGPSDEWGTHKSEFNPIYKIAKEELGLKFNLLDYRGNKDELKVYDKFHKEIPEKEFCKWDQMFYGMLKKID